MAEAKQKTMTVEEFFEWQEHQDQNYELRYGVPVLCAKAMTGASELHDRVTVIVIIALGNRLRGKPCSPRTDDKSLKTHVGTRRPDVTIECGKPDGKSLQSDGTREAN